MQVVPEQHEQPESTRFCDFMCPVCNGERTGHVMQLWCMRELVKMDFTKVEGITVVTEFWMKVKCLFCGHEHETNDFPIRWREDLKGGAK